MQNILHCSIEANHPSFFEVLRAMHQVNRWHLHFEHSYVHDLYSELIELPDNISSNKELVQTLLPNY